MHKFFVYFYSEEEAVANRWQWEGTGHESLEEARVAAEKAIKNGAKEAHIYQRVAEAHIGAVWA